MIEEEDGGGGEQKPGGGWCPGWEETSTMETTGVVTEVDSEEVRWVHVLQRNASGGGKHLLLTWLEPKSTQPVIFPPVHQGQIRSCDNKKGGGLPVMLTTSKSLQESKSGAVNQTRTCPVDPVEGSVCLCVCCMCVERGMGNSYTPT